MRQSGMNINIVRSLLGLVALAAVVSFVGCGSGVDMGEVTGTVTLDGQPVANLEVNFEPIDASLGTTATGYTQAAGEYELFYPGGKKGAPVGEYTVRIVSAELDEEAGPPIRIPAKYNAESDLIRVVETGDNSFDFELTSR